MPGSSSILNYLQKYIIILWLFVELVLVENVGVSTLLNVLRLV